MNIGKRIKNAFMDILTLRYNNNLKKTPILTSKN